MSFVNILSASLAPIIAIIGIIIAILNYQLALRKRRDDLFDKRYAFYQKVEKIWMSTGNGAHPEDKPYFEWDDIEPWAHEAEFLFDKEIADHLRSFTEKEFKGISGVPDPDFSKPFKKYLSFE